MSSSGPCIWKEPFTECLALDTSQFTNNVALAFGISGNGSTVYGGGVEGSRWYACKWDTTTLQATVLDHSSLPNVDMLAVAASDDGSIIYGGAPQYEQEPIGVQPIVMWTDGGNSGTTLTLRTGASYTAHYYDEVYSFCVFGLNWCSDDGLTVVGYDDATVPEGYLGVKWVNNIPHDLSNVPDPLYGATAQGVAPNASITAGAVTVTDSTGFPIGAEGCYWIGSTLFRLVLPANAPTTSAFLFESNWPNAAATVIWGYGNPLITSALQRRAYYWDNLSTLSGDGIHYGVPHLMDELPNTQQPDDIYSAISWVARDALVAVGRSPSGDSDIHAVRWDGTTITDLGVGDSFSIATGCNHDGSIVVGYNDQYNKVPLWWDAANVRHVLPSLAALDDPFKGEADGISRDGSVIFGFTHIAEQPVSSSLQLTDIEIIATPLPTDEHITLRWSDDLGCSWQSNGILRSLGKVGEYLTSPTWYRLGMSRRRIFELSWSGARAEALQGVVIEVEIANS